MIVAWQLLLSWIRPGSCLSPAPSHGYSAGGHCQCPQPAELEIAQAFLILVQSRHQHSLLRWPSVDAACPLTLINSRSTDILEGHHTVKLLQLRALVRTKDSWQPHGSAVHLLSSGGLLPALQLPTPNNQATRAAASWAAAVETTLQWWSEPPRLPGDALAQSISVRVGSQNVMQRNTTVKFPKGEAHGFSSHFYF